MFIRVIHFTIVIYIYIIRTIHRHNAIEVPKVRFTSVRRRRRQLSTILCRGHILFYLFFYYFLRIFHVA